MAPPRLLDKKLIQVSLAAERKQEVERGVKLAKSIDALRETKEKEEIALTEFRELSIKEVQAAISATASENILISEENRRLKEERIRLETPVDLTEAWNEVHTLKAAQEDARNYLLVREIEVSKRENDVYDTSKALQARELTVSKFEEETRGNLLASEGKLEKAAQVRDEAQSKLSTLEQRIAENESAFAEKEQELGDREDVIVGKERTIEEETLAITNEKIYLADQRATLERGFAELRRKQQQ